jgi:hypothetical protein
MNKNKNKIMNKLKQFSLILILTSLFTLTSAEYKAVIGTANHNITFVKWETTSPIEGSWNNVNQPYGCTNWTPAATSKPLNEQFTQTATDCKQDQERQVQLRSIEKNSGKIKIIETITENRTNTGQTSTKSATGTQPAVDCRYTYITASGSGAANYYILADGGNSYPYWGGVQVGKGNGPNPTTYVNGGYLYYSTKLMLMSGFVYYNLCRKPL